MNNKKFKKKEIWTNYIIAINMSHLLNSNCPDPLYVFNFTIYFKKG